MDQKQKSPKKTDPRQPHKYREKWLWLGAARINTDLTKRHERHLKNREDIKEFEERKISNLALIPCQNIV